MSNTSTQTASSRAAADARKAAKAASKGKKGKAAPVRADARKARSKATGNGQPTAAQRDREIARMAQQRSKPAAKISGPNITRLRKGLGRKTPLDYLGISQAQLDKLSKGSKVKLDDDQRAKLDELAGLARGTFYGRKLGGMLWAIQKERS